jgi:hypothetical protein
VGKPEIAEIAMKARIIFFKQVPTFPAGCVKPTGWPVENSQDFCD